MFIDLTFFGRVAEIANQYLRKGSKVLVDGRLVLEQWTAQDGTKRSKHSVTVESMQMLDSRSVAVQNNKTAPQQKTSAQNTEKQKMHQVQNIPRIDKDEDKIPF